MKHLRYLRYILRHKLYVLLAWISEAKRFWNEGWYELAAEIIWRGLVHDLSKLLPSEWFPYVEWFYGEPPNDYWVNDERVCMAVARARRKREFDTAWLFHQHRNRHHWQHWVLNNDDGTTRLLPMPELDRLEMLCDWYGAGWAINGEHGWDRVAAWYAKNGRNMKLEEGTRDEIERFLLERGKTPVA